MALQPPLRSAEEPRTSRPLRRHRRSQAPSPDRGGPTRKVSGDTGVIRKTDALTGLDDATRIADTIIAPFGACELTILEQSGDIDFVRNSLAILLPPLRDLASPTYEA